MKRALVAVACAAVLAVPALPGRAAAQSSSSAVAVELSRLVLPEASWNTIQRGTAEQLRQMIEGTFQQNGVTATPELAERLVAETGAMISYQEIVDMQAGLLVKHYTEPELKELLAFYKAPLGQKAIRIMPEVMQDVNGQMMALMQQRLPAMMERLKPLIEKAAAAKQPAAKQPAAAPAKKPAKKPAS